MARMTRNEEMQKIDVRVYRLTDDGALPKQIDTITIQTDHEYSKDKIGNAFFEEFKDMVCQKLCRHITSTEEEDANLIIRGFSRNTPDRQSKDCDFSTIYSYSLRPDSPQERFLLKANVLTQAESN